ncbi:MAG: cadmium-translocating P-type ATPase [Mycobacterium pseudokansasii]|uniref:Putative cation-transporting ATPase G n=1 Tax=Mycobacterium pseudokansasii TaxID=2341080 RepID=A0A498QP02_9MYCO|nr:heavy metal translocating P-type ATPase [Mycobacterium pseudokansasii]MBY0388461.1 cadmium-translocating P-type ATPase [Mycobacterium pseudokansasii]VAZ91484.1 putative cation-transporting ATPase G [Mycobacterium pseudokansasii]VAZ92438.1 putative cation-transporting ATPase G [Mycobacterium pseudokansasii]VBA48643.1 putative cation-transporting ATPase G [Mycobacterium pseudokansasii]
MLTTDSHPATGVRLTVVSATSGRMRVCINGFRLGEMRAIAIEDAVGEVAGVEAVQAYPRTASVVIWHAPARCDTAAVLSAIAEAVHTPATAVPERAPRSADGRRPGLAQRVIDWSTRIRSGSCAGAPGRPGRTVSDGCCDHDDNDGPEQLWQVVKLRRAALSGALLTGSVITAWVTPLGPVALGMKVLALAIGASTFAPSAINRLAQGRIGVGTLMTIAGAGAVGLGRVGEAAMLAFLFSISEGLEEYAVSRTRRGLRALLSLVPDDATVLRGDTETVVPAADLQVGDQMIVKAGERLATDGIILDGRTALDVSAITGESVPVEAGPGDEVFAGSINGSGVLLVEVTTTAEDNSLARIVHIVEAEQARKGASQRLADRIARPLVPSILVAGAAIAGAGSIFGSPTLWIERALVVLVAASPCALAIAVPVAVVAAIGAAAKFGVLIKGGAALESLGTIGLIALDKTGTLTANRPKVIDVATTNGATREEVLAIAAALEARSEHPLAPAVLAATAAPIGAASDVQAIPGAGLTGRLDGHNVRLGRPGWFDSGDLTDHVSRMQQGGATAVLVERDEKLLGAIAVRDELRPEAAEVVAELRAGGYQVAMLTGDNHATAAALAAQAGIGDVYAELRPEDKARLVAELRAQRPTAMVGDGVNDAPALAAADLGIAMGAMGTDVAIETADVALMGQDLRHLPQALDHARRSRQIMLQNIGLSLAIITVLMPLSLFGTLGLAAVVFVHELTEVVVIANGVRAGRINALAGSTQAL